MTMVAPALSKHNSMDIPKGTVVGVAMSGGVDSSVAAALLCEQGCEVIGLTMHLWSDPTGTDLPLNRASGCCSITMAQDAAAVAGRMGFKHYVLNLSEEFHGSVVKNFAGEYLAGRTPNPCVRCNTFVKWQTLLERARRMGCDFLATGHYARVTRGGQRVALQRARYADKDQTYALWGLSQDALSSTVFPIGEMTKSEVREIARRYGLVTADKPESQDICFVPDNDYRRFIGANFEAELSVLQPGEIIGPTGAVLGTHTGIANYTIGQRKGLGIGGGGPYYVTRIAPGENRVYVSSDEECRYISATLGEMNWVSWAPRVQSFKCDVKVRYRDSVHGVTVRPAGASRASVVFEEPVRAVTPGQSAVFYDGDTVIAGGVIMTSELAEGV